MSTLWALIALKLDSCTLKYLIEVARHLASTPDCDLQEFFPYAVLLIIVFIICT
jgi:hypothetical protein